MEQRPEFNEHFLRLLSEKIGLQLLEWIRDDSPLEELIEDAAKVLKWHHNDNGYEIAKAFENNLYYSPDAGLVELCENVSSEKYDLLRVATKEWVIRNDIRPQFDIGTEVMVKFHKGLKPAIITGWRLETAEYLVCIPSEGQTIEGGSKYIIKYENPELLTPQTLY